VRNDIGDRLAVDGENHPLACPDGIDDLAGPIPQVTYADLHVRQRSTTVNWDDLTWEPVAQARTSGAAPQPGDLVLDAARAWGTNKTELRAALNAAVERTPGPLPPGTPSADRSASGMPRGD